MGNKLIAVSPEDMDTALELVDRKGFLSKRKPCSIEVKEGSELIVEALLFRGSIDYELWEIEERGTLVRAKSQPTAELTKGMEALPNLPKPSNRRRRTNAQLLQDGLTPGTLRKSSGRTEQKRMR